jgi:transcriptional regulator with XRE-family HTH domain
MGNRIPDTRLAAMLGVARRELGMTTREAARVCGRSMESVTNQEAGNCRMAEAPTRALLLHYLNRLGAPAPQAELPLGQLVEGLARAVLLRRAAHVADLLASADAGADAVVRAVCLDGLRGERLTGQVIRRLRYRLESEARKRDEMSAGIVSHVRAG